MPTVLDLAGVMNSDIESAMDGKSMKNLLKSNDEMKSNFRQYFLSEYISSGTNYNNKGHIWQDGHTTSDRCGTDPKKDSGPIGPDPDTTEEDCVMSENVGDGNCWMLDSLISNNWRQLRIMNETMNWNYVEYDEEWKFEVTDPSGAGLQHYELYDVTEDPYQMKNLYSSTSIKLGIGLKPYF